MARGRLTPSSVATTGGVGGVYQTLYDVRAYGAKVDGATVDTAAVLLAQAAAAANGHGVVYAPPGTLILDNTFVFTSSHVVIKGAGRGVSRIKWKDSTAYPATGLFSCTDYYGQIGNHFEDVTIDFNGMNNGLLPFQTPLVLASSWAHFKRVEFCNRPGVSGAPVESGWCALVEGRGVTFEDCLIHDDWGAATWTTAPPGNAGAVSLAVASSATAQTTGNVIIDPSVSVFHVAAVTGSGTPQAVTPRREHENEWLNGAPATALRGLYVGQTLQVGNGAIASVAVAGGGTGYTDGTYLTVPFTGGAGNNGGGALATVVISGGIIQSVTVTGQGWGNAAAPALDLATGGNKNGTLTAITTAGTAATFTVTMTDLVEAVAVTAISATQWTGIITLTHPANFAATYAGTTETCLITSVPDGTHINVTTQLTHAASVAVLIYPFVSDGIGIGNNKRVARPTDDIHIIDCEFWRLGLDASGSATMKRIIWRGNYILDCIVGLIVQDTHNAKPEGNTIDLSGLGLPPLGSPNYNCITLYAQAPEYATADLDTIIEGNTLTGGYTAIYNVPLPGTGIVHEGLVIGKNTMRGQYGPAIVLSSVRKATVVGNTIANPNQASRSTDILSGGDTCAILLVANGSKQVVDTVNIHSNTMSSDGKCQAAICGVAAAGTWKNVSAQNNQFDGFSRGTPLWIQYSAGFPILNRHNNPTNPLGAVTMDALGATGSTVQTTQWYTPYTSSDYYVLISGGTVTAVAVANQVVGGTPLTHGFVAGTAGSSSPATTVALVPAGGGIKVTFTGSPSWFWLAL